MCRRQGSLKVFGISEAVKTTKLGVEEAVLVRESIEEG